MCNSTNAVFELEFHAFEIDMAISWKRCCMHQQKGMENISITWRGKKFILEMNPDATLKQLGDELQKLTDVKADTMRLISPQSSNKSSTLLHPFSEEHSGQSLQELSLFERKSIRMMGVPKGEVDELLQNAKADLRIAGFDEEEKRLRQRTGRPHISPKLPQGTYIFCDFCTLHLPGVELNPPASEALALMHRLASDQGIVAIMNKHRWRVGIMTEMAPEGYVGVSPKCILGFNKNHGEEISLRLRTDDLKGFRKYVSIKKTLLHELAHMVHSEHDANFYALDKLINQEAASLDWTRSRSHTLSGIRHSEHHVDEVYVDNSTSVSHRVGGKSSEQLANARESSVAAAYRRLADTSTKMLAPSGAQEEPDPDDSVPHSRVEHDHFNAIDKENALNRNISQWEFKNEPYLDDSNVSEKKFEPDPDDSMDGEAMQSESADSGGNVTMEPDPDDSMNVHFVPALANKRDFEGTKGYDEPDPDDLQTCLGGRRMVELDHFEEMDTLDCMAQTRKNISKPDPDYSRSGKHIIEWGNMDGPCHDGTMENERPLDSSCEEPLPDDSQADGMMETEPDPDENTEPNPDDNMVPLNEISHMQIDVHDQELKRIQDPVTIFCGRLQKAIEMLRSEVSTVEAATILQTLFKIIRNVIEHPDEMEFKQLRKANPTIQKTVANYKGAMEILFLIGFNEDVVLDEIGKAETYLILKRNDPGLLWLAKSSLEACIAY